MIRECNDILAFLASLREQRRNSRLLERITRALRERLSTIRGALDAEISRRRVNHTGRKLHSGC